MAAAHGARMEAQSLMALVRSGAETADGVRRTIALPPKHRAEMLAGTAQDRATVAFRDATLAEFDALASGSQGT